jgi:hypothetical protein
LLGFFSCVVRNDASADRVDGSLGQGSVSGPVG